ncbi:MAG: Hsp20 family protein, partial [Holosporaceae bacterium]|nr:Hsp20 family protein [Holosporaceae bacterium]
RGRQESDPKSVYIYRGIATRQFTKTFVLADGVEVKSAEFDNGLLHLNLLRVKNEGNARTIEIISKSNPTKTQQIEDVTSDQ